MRINWGILILLIILCNVIGGLGGIWTSSDSDWYSNLEKPVFNPPSWLFSPVWITIFTLMGIALYFIVSSPPSDSKGIALVLFIVQFVFNISWSYMFFGLQSPLYGLVNILILLGLIGFMIDAFFKVNRKAGWLLIPYFLWVCFAALLNYSIWKLNFV